MNNKEKILVGQFGSPIGLKGEIKVNFMTSNFETFKKLKNYTNFHGSLEWNFKKITYKGNKCVVHPDKSFSREDALKLKGEKIYSSKTFFPTLKNNEFYVNDLIGCKLFLTNNNHVSDVLDVKNFGAGDLLEIKYNNKKIFIPFDKANIVSINLNKKEIFANPIQGILD